MNLFSHVLRSLGVLNLFSIGAGLICALIAQYLAFWLGSILALMACFGVALYATAWETPYKLIEDMSILSFILSMILVLGSFWVLQEFLFLKTGKLLKISSIQAEEVVSDDYVFFQVDTSYKVQDNIIAYTQVRTKQKDSSPSYSDYFAVPLHFSPASDVSLFWLGLKYSSGNSKYQYQRNLRQFKKDIQKPYTYFARHSTNLTSFRKALKKLKNPPQNLKSTIVLYGIDSPQSALQDQWDYLRYLFMGINSLWVFALLSRAIYVFFYPRKEGASKKG